MMSKSIDTWLCQINGEHFAIPTKRLRMLIEEPETISVLGSHPLFHRMLMLQNQFFPLLENNYYFSVEAEYSVAALVPYIHPETKIMNYGALELDDAPTKIVVNDDLLISLEELDELNAKLSVAAFNYGDRKVGVLDIDNIFKQDYFG